MSVVCIIHAILHVCSDTHGQPASRPRPGRPPWDECVLVVESTHIALGDEVGHEKTVVVQVEGAAEFKGPAEACDGFADRLGGHVFHASHATELLLRLALRDGGARLPTVPTTMVAGGTGRCRMLVVRVEVLVVLRHDVSVCRNYSGVGFEWVRCGKLDQVHSNPMSGSIMFLSYSTAQCRCCR